MDALNELARQSALPLPEAAAHGVALFNAGHFFEQHEALEAAWRAEPGPVRALYQGILQTGVGLLHLQRNNLIGARKVFERAARHLAPLPAVCQGVDVAALRADLDRVMAAPAPGSAITVRLLAAPSAIVAPRTQTMPYDFSNKIALITGSGRGIGKVTALRFAQMGADVVINYFRKREAAEETAREIEALGRRALIVKADVGDPDDLTRLFAEVDAAFGGLDFLVNNAASGYIRPVMEQKVKGWDWTMNINARSALFATQLAVPLMRRRGGGAVVNITSIGSARTLPDYVVIGASKGALEVVTRYCAVELSPDNIVVNAISPGMIDTDAIDHFKNGDLMLEVAAQRTPAGRLVSPEDVAGLVTFLCSKDANMIRGQVIFIDGGYMVSVR